MTTPQKVRYLRYASSFVVAAYCQYASFLRIRRPGSRTFYEAARFDAFYRIIKYGKALSFDSSASVTQQILAGIGLRVKVYNKDLVAG
jgi:hypothetical protein